MRGMEHYIDGRALGVRVRRSSRARYASVSVPALDAVEVVLPRRVANRHVPAILAEKEGWIRRRLRRLAAIEPRAALLGLREAGVVWVHGAPVPIQLGAGEDGGGWTARLREGRLVISPSRAAAQDTGREDAVMRWYRREARRRIRELVGREATVLGVTPSGVSVRDQSTRWGSCSSAARLSFSWRLLLAPFDVLDYVVVHELCHLRELNHSTAFWRHVEQARPGYRRQLEWLRDFGEELHRYRPVLETSRPAELDASGQIQMRFDELDQWVDHGCAR